MKYRNIINCKYAFGGDLKLDLYVSLSCFEIFIWNTKRNEMFVKGKLMLIAIEVLKLKARNIENI